MELIILSLTVVGLIFWLSRKKPQQTRPAQETDKSTIHIVVENGAANKEKATERNAIIHEAETLFFTLQKKYLYSPLPFKVLGDFYVQKGLSDKAVEKYSQMIRYLNADLTLEKLSDAINYLRAAGAEQEADSIEAYYQKKDVT